VAGCIGQRSASAQPHSGWKWQELGAVESVLVASVFEAQLQLLTQEGQRLAKGSAQPQAGKRMHSLLQVLQVMVKSFRLMMMSQAG
jgi:hypothetical protein